MKKLLLNVFSISIIGSSSSLTITNLATDVKTKINKYISPSPGDIILKDKLLGMFFSGDYYTSNEEATDVLEYSYAAYSDTIDGFFEIDPIIGDVCLDFYSSIGNDDEWKTSKSILDSYHNTQGHASELKKYLNNYVVVTDKTYDTAYMDAYGQVHYVTTEAKNTLKITNDATNKKIIFDVDSYLSQGNQYETIYNTINYMDGK